jgi:hypothetical protein
MYLVLWAVEMSIPDGPVPVSEVGAKLGSVILDSKHIYICPPFII